MSGAAILSRDDWRDLQGYLGSVRQVRPAVAPQAPLGTDAGLGTDGESVGGEGLPATGQEGTQVEEGPLIPPVRELDEGGAGPTEGGGVETQQEVNERVEEEGAQ